MLFFTKLQTCSSKVDVFFILFYFFSESPQTMLQDFGRRFFNFILFAIFIVEKLEMLEIYQKSQIIHFTFKKPYLKAKIRISIKF